MSRGSDRAYHDIRYGGQHAQGDDRTKITVRLAKDDAEMAEALKEYKSSHASSGTTSLGDLLKEQLDQEEQMDEES